MLSITAIVGNAATQILRWERFWGGVRDEKGWGISVSGEYIYVSGRTMSFGAGEDDAVILKYDLSGTLIHDTTWGGSTFDVGHKVHVSDGNVYVAGTTWSFGYQNAFLLKFDSDCNLLWDRLWGYPYYGGYENFFDVFVVGDDVYCVGEAEIGWGNPLLLLQRYDTYGNLQWSSLWGPKGPNVHTSGRGITVSGNDIYVVGWTESTPGPVAPYDALIQKYDTSGNLIWSRTWGGAGGDFAYDVSVLGNDVYVVGYTNSYGVGGDDIFLLKYDSAANLIWYKTWGGIKEDLGYEICISNGHIYVAGTTKSFGAGGYDAVTLKTDLSGNPIWYETWGGTADDEAHSIYVADNEIYVVGDTTSFGSGGKDIFLLKYAEVITATIDIDPDTLNLKSHGQWITAYIELPECYNVEDIDLDSIKLCHHDFWLPAVTDPKYGFVTDPNVYMVDHDGDGYIDRLVKFDRQILIDYLKGQGYGDGDMIELTVTGEATGTRFEGFDTIQVISKGKS